MHALQWLRGLDAQLTASLAFDCGRMQGEIAGGSDSLDEL
jgi:hypothetical protein